VFINKKYDLDKNPYLLSIIMFVVVLASISITTYMLYQTAYDKQRDRLQETVVSQARLIEAVARFDQLNSTTVDSSSEFATLSQIRDAHSRYRGLSKTGEFVLGKLENGEMVFLLENHNQIALNNTFKRIKAEMGGDYAVPMQRALLGQSGIIVDKDYQGVEVLAAYEPVAILNYGVVAKIDLAEIQQPFIVTAAVAILISLMLTVVSAIGFHHLTAPLIKRLINSEQQAVKANRTKDEFLAAMSHELRTPLTSIIGSSEILVNLISDEKQNRLLRSIEVAGQSQLALVNDILDMSKIESGKFTIDEHPYDLSHFIADIKQLFSVRAQDAGLQLKVIQQAKPDFQLIGDKQRIGQVLINLLGNAIKFTEKGSVVLTVSTHQNQLHFSVQDSGIGIPREVRSQLFQRFQRFQQADQSISRRFGGSGLGLYISHNLIGMMKGSIDVESVEGVGSTFTINLPYRESKQPIVEYDATNHHSQGSSHHYYGKVLVVEDTQTLQMMERYLLESMGAEVSVANHGEEAVTLAMQERFDLIFMDMQMPVMDGIEATRILREKGNQTPIVALTANVMQSHRDAFEAAGCDDFIGKPFDKMKLESVLKQYLSGEEQVKKSTNTLSIPAPMMEEFFRGYAEYRKSLITALAAEGWVQVRKITHDIKGSGAVFGYPLMSKRGGEICQLLDEEQYETATSSVEKLIVEIENLQS
jgi:signal transduction histidine kinase/ActR/RegA family two-component response regulator